MNLFKFILAVLIIFVNFTAVAQRPLHYVFMGIPSYGHLKPTLEIVKALTTLGHNVSYFSVPKFKNEIEAVGAKFIDYNSASARNVQSINSRSMDLALAYKTFNNIMAESWPTIVEFKKLNNIDVIVYDQFAVWGKLLAHQYKIPSVCSSIMWLRSANDWMQISSTIPKETSHFSYQEMLSCLACTGADKVITYTSSVFQSEFENSDNVIFFGNRYDSKSLQNHKSFNDTSIIYISFGTLFNCDSSTLGQFIDFFTNTSYRIIISTGGNEEVYNKLLKKKISKNIKIYKFVDQEDILSKASLFITHAGASSLYEAISFSTPIIMVPQMEEQYINAHKARELDLGYILDSKNVSDKDIHRALGDIKQNWQKYMRASSRIRQTFLNSFNAERVARSIEIK